MAKKEREVGEVEGLRASHTQRGEAREHASACESSWEAEGPGPFHLLFSSPPLPPSPTSLKCKAFSAPPTRPQRESAHLEGHVCPLKDLHPPPTLKRRALTSKVMSAFWTHRRAILFSIFSARKPGVPFLTMKALTWGR